MKTDPKRISRRAKGATDFSEPAVKLGSQPARHKQTHAKVARTWLNDSLTPFRPPWVLTQGEDGADGSLGSIFIAPNSGAERTGTVHFQVAVYDMVAQCSVDISQSGALAPRLTSPSILPSGTFQFGIAGATNQTCVIEASQDLLNWVPIATNSSPCGSFIFSDTTVSSHATRFYRVAVSP